MRYWMSRPDRNRLDYFWAELEEGRLRQGWGYQSDQDLRVVAGLPWEARSPAQQDTWRQRRMLESEPDSWQDGDIVLVPNMPTFGMFALARVAGPYRFEIDPETKDYGHIRPVELITRAGVAKQSKFVRAGIHSLLRVVSRTCNADGYKADIDHILNHRDDAGLLTESHEAKRIEKALDDATRAGIDAIRKGFGESLAAMLKPTHWEYVIAAALKERFPRASIQQTGGPSEEGADIEIEMANPFGGAPLIFVVQVKNWDGVAGVYPAEQLRQAIETRRVVDDDGRIGRHVAGAVLALTRATPSAELEIEISAIEHELHVPVTVIGGDALVALILRGALEDAFMTD